MILVIIAAVAWLACAVFAAGLFFADSQASFPQLAAKYRRKDLGWALGLSLLAGPVALVIAVFDTGFGEHGWRLR
jgi:predicted exporter